MTHRPARYWHVAFRSCTSNHRKTHIERLALAGARRNRAAAFRDLAARKASPSIRRQALKTTPFAYRARQQRHLSSLDVALQKELRKRDTFE